MSSLYKRARSPYWWIRMKVSGEWKSKNTGLRWDSLLDTKRAKILALDRSVEESAKDSPREETGWGWVPAWLNTGRISPLTASARALHWRHIRDFLLENEILSPTAVRHLHAQEYIAKRTATKRHNGKLISRNTAIMELKTFKSVLTEAVNRGIIEAPPFSRVKLQRDAPAEKPEITADEQSIIEAALDREPAWMQRSWLIAMSTGCRLRETRIELRNVSGTTISFPSPKGGRKKAYAVPIPASLVPLFAEMRRKRQKITLEFPFQPSRQWGLFFQRLGLSHLCFHCTRVTFITRLARAGAPLSTAMRLVNHASTAVHRIYQRVQLHDLEGWADKIAPAPPPPTSPRPHAASARNPRAKSSPRSSGSPASPRASAPARKSARSRRRAEAR